MRFWLTVLILAHISYQAIRRGGAPERFAAAVFSFAFAFEFLAIKAAGLVDFQSFNVLRMFLDVGSFVCLVWIALRANRWWPFWICGLQLAVVAGHISAFLKIPAIAGVYWAMTTIPYYLEYFVLLIGLFNHSWRMRMSGVYPDWTTHST